MRKLLLLVLLFSFMSCSFEYKMKRIANKTRKKIDKNLDEINRQNQENFEKGIMPWDTSYNTQEVDTIQK